MKKLINLVIIMVFLWINTYGQQQYSVGKLKSKIDQINNRFASSFLAKNLIEVINYYQDNAVYMPEYHHTLFSKKDIQSYFKQLLDSANFTQYHRDIYEVFIIKDVAVETGTFKNQFTKTGKDSFDYIGKYIRIWKVIGKDSLQVLSEINGATQNIERSSLPLSVFREINYTEMPQPKANKLKQQIDKRNSEIAHLVKTRNGAAMSAYYTKDAIYMPYYMPMQIGQVAINAYYSEHESPEVKIDSVKINASKITDLGEYVLVHGYYQVRWRAGNASGLVTGKSINIWKRLSDKSLLLYRQMVCHD